MKILLTVLFILVAVPVLGDDIEWSIDSNFLIDLSIDSNLPTAIITYNPQTDEFKIDSKEEFKEIFIDSGMVCDIIGHKWEVLPDFITYPTHPPTYPPLKRECQICGLLQEEKIVQQEIKSWIDVD